MCHRCALSLVGEGFQWVEDRPHCAICSAREYVERSGKEVVHGLTAEEAGRKHRASECGDVRGVLELIGDKLEACLSGMVPKCGKCGGPFETSQNLVIQGMSKFHLSCPSKEEVRMQQAHSAGASQQKAAVLSSPAMLTIRVQGESGQKITFFFTKITQDQGAVDKNSSSAEIWYRPDDSAHAKVKRKLTGGLGKPGCFPLISTGGGDGFDSVAASISIPEDLGKPLVSANISKTSVGLTFSVSVSFLWDGVQNELEAQILILRVKLAA